MRRLILSLLLYAGFSGWGCARPVPPAYSTGHNPQAAELMTEGDWQGASRVLREQLYRPRSGEAALSGDARIEALLLLAEAMRLQGSEDARPQAEAIELLADRLGQNHPRLEPYFRDLARDGWASRWWLDLSQRALEWLVERHETRLDERRQQARPPSRLRKWAESLGLVSPREHREESLALAESLHGLGVVRFEFGQIDSAHAALQRSQSLFERYLNGDQPQLVDVEAQLARVALDEARLDDARRWLESAEARSRAGAGSSAAPPAVVLYTWVDLFLARGDQEALTKAVERAVAADAERFLSEGADRGFSSDTLADWGERLPSLQEAKPKLRKESPLMIHWAADPEATRRHIVWLLERMGDVEARDRVRKLLGASPRFHYQRRRLEAIATATRLRRGDYRRAYDGLLQALDLERPSAVGANPRERERVRHSLLELSAELRESLVEVRDIGLPADEEVAALFGAEHSELGRHLALRAALMAEDGDHEGARIAYQRAIELMEKRLGLYPPPLAFALLGLAKIEMTQGLVAGASLHMSRAVEIRERVLGRDRLVVVSLQCSLADAQALAGDWKGVERTLDRIESTLKRRNDAPGPVLAKFEARRARLALARGEKQEADQLMASAMARIEDAGRTFALAVADVLESRAAYHVQKYAEKRADAAPIERQAAAIRSIAQSGDRAARIAYRTVEPSFYEARGLAISRDEVDIGWHRIRARVDMALGNTEKAEQHLRDLLEIFELGNASGMHLSQVWLDLADFARERGDTAAAAELERRSEAALLDVMRTLPEYWVYAAPERASEVEEVLAKVANALRVAGRHEEAEELCRDTGVKQAKAVTIRHMLENPDYNQIFPTLGLFLDAYVARLERLGRDQEAEAVRPAAERVWRHTHPQLLGSRGSEPGHRLSLMGWLIEATDQMAWNQYESAAEKFERLVRINELDRGADHVDVAAALENLAYAQQELGHTEEAARLRARAREILTASDDDARACYADGRIRDARRASIEAMYAYSEGVKIEIPSRYYQYALDIIEHSLADQPGASKALLKSMMKEVSGWPDKSLMTKVAARLEELRDVPDDAPFPRCRP